MRQGNGSDLMGANDPRSASIGIVYVAPNDERESVQAAILTQEKLGREQIAIVLPEQNKAFHRPVDFDGLKHMRGKLRARLVIIAPPGSYPAELARQRRFTYFTSLESYGRSLRDVREAPRSDRNGGRWPFNRRPAPPLNPAIPVNEAGEQKPAPIPPDGEQGESQAAERDVQPGSAAAMGAAAGLGAAALPGDDAALQQPAEEGAQLAAPSQGEEVTAPEAPQELEDTPSPASLDRQANAAEPSSPVQEPEPGGDIITLPARKRNAAAPHEEDDTPTLVPPGGIKRRNSAKTPSVVVPVAGATAVAARSRVTAKLPVVGGNPPGVTAAGRGRSGSSRGRWGLLFLLLLALLVLFATVAYAAPGALPTPVHNFFSNIASGGSPVATVTITPRSVDELNTYVLSGITSAAPDRARRQVQVRQLTSTPPPQSKTVPATGVVDTPAVQATGTLTFYNGNGTAYSVRAQTVFTDASGVSVENNGPVVIPAGSPAVGYGRASVAATALTGGSRGNIPSGDFSLMQCCGSGSVFVSNGSFSGGQDPQHYTAVQQGDIDGAANPLKQPLLQSSLAALNGMKHANEAFVATPACSVKVTSNQPTGAKATSVTATVSATCTGEVYDQGAAQAIVTDLLKTRATQELGSGYTLQGNVATRVTSTQTDPQGNLSLFVKAEGIWVYQFSDAQKAQLLQHIKGMSTKDTIAYLQSQPGVGHVTITLNGNNSATLPTDPNAISIIVNAPGVQGTATPTSGPGGSATPPTQGPGGSGITPTSAPPTPQPSSPATPYPSPSVGGS